MARTLSRVRLPAFGAWQTELLKGASTRSFWPWSWCWGRRAGMEARDARGVAQGEAEAREAAGAHRVPSGPEAFSVSIVNTLPNGFRFSFVPSLVYAP